jgi:CRP-like cAMP-binding protein
MHRRPEFARVRGMLGKSAYFRNLDAGVLDGFAELCRLRRLRDGALASSVRSKMNELWIVLGGALRLSGVTSDGEEFVYAILGRGSFYGLGHVIQSVPTIMDVHAYGDTELAAMDGAALIAMLDRSPKLWRDVCCMLLTHRLTLAVALIRDLSVAPLGQRIAQRLLGQAMSAAGDIDGSGAPIELRITQGDLGRMLGASRSKVNAKLKSFEARGLIKVGYRTLALTDPGGLRKISGPDLFAF